MKVLLIDPPGWQKHSLNLGLAYLAGAVQAANSEVQILDMNNHVYPEERIKEIIIDYSPKVIGISVKTATANASAEIIRRLKNIFPHIIYVVGGPHITLCGKEFIQENKEIDLGIMGEGERSLVNLIKNIKEGRKDISEINGICYRNNGSSVFSNVYEKPDISKLTFPVFDCVRDMDFTNFRYPLLTSRGCPHGCIFCCVGLISGKKWRFREPGDVVNELLQAKDSYQIQYFEIMDDNFTFDIDRAKKICMLIIKKKLHLHWWCHNGLRADRLDQGLLNLMKKAGCTSIALGVESGDEKVFNTINKGEKLSDIVRAVKMIKKAGIKSVGYFIVGLPGDSIDSTKRSIRFQRGLGLSDYKYNILVPYPGTKIWENVKEKGRLLTEIKGAYHFGDNIKIPFETDKISKKTLEQCMYLVENQEWVRGENDIINIRKDFNVRFGRNIKRAVFIENDSKSAAKNIEIECKNANVLNIKNECILDEIKDKYLLKSDCEGSNFDALLKLMQAEGWEIILDISKKRLLMRRVKKIENEYVRGEILPHLSKWDGSARRYFAIRLKKSSPSICSAKNGIIYKDSIALPFSPDFQCGKTPCGKIESGLAFISASAFSLNSTYTADYATANREFELQELIISDNKESALERILAESDILFCPETLGYFSLVFSRAAMNVVYYCTGHGINSLRYKALDQFFIGYNYYFTRKARQILDIKRKIKNDFRNSIKSLFWPNSLMVILLQRLKKSKGRTKNFLIYVSNIVQTLWLILRFLRVKKSLLTKRNSKQGFSYDEYSSYL